MQDKEFMKKAIELSKAAVEHGNEPFGAVLVKDGKIVEQGKHEELLRKGGYYHDLYSKQFQEEEMSSKLNS